MTPLERAARLRLMLFDIDGVLTDGRLYFDAGGEALKVFHSHDGHGLHLLREAGVAVGVISGRDSPATRARLAELKFDFVALGIHDKPQALAGIVQQSGWALEQIGFMGDDWVDLAVLQQVGFAATVACAASYVDEYVHWQSTRPGGSGAVREVAEFILQAQQKLNPIFLRHLHV